ncbi:hypothetical protein ACOZZR_004197, partial [Cronobacter sakazakii]
TMPVQSLPAFGRAFFSEAKMDLYKLQVAQSKLAIAHFIGDGEMWQQALMQIKQAIGANWYKSKGSNNK